MTNAFRKIFTVFAAACLLFSVGCKSSYDSERIKTDVDIAATEKANVFAVTFNFQQANGWSASPTVLAQVGELATVEAENGRLKIEGEILINKVRRGFVDRHHTVRVFKEGNLWRTDDRFGTQRFTKN